MSWHEWVDGLRQNPQQAVTSLLRGAANITPFERVSAHEFLLAVLPRDGRTVSRTLLGEPKSAVLTPESNADLPALLDIGLAAWLQIQRQSPLPVAKKLGAYAAQVCEALQWPLYFKLPQTREVLQARRAEWLRWLGSLVISAYRDPEYDYWQVLAAQQADDRLQFFWQSFVVEAGRTRSLRYLNLGLLALARLPISEDDSLRNLRLQVQALINRYQRRKGWGTPAQEEFAQALLGVMARNPSMSTARYREFLVDLLAPLGEDKSLSILSLMGLVNVQAHQHISAFASGAYKLEPPGLAQETTQAVRAVRQSVSLMQAWESIRSLLGAHESFVYRTGDAYYFVRTLDKCARALCKKYTLYDPEIQGRLLQWVHLALRMDADDPRLWMLWELVLRRAGYPQRAQWVLWEMTRRFPDHLPCRVELARLLAESSTADNQTQARRLLQQVLQLDPEHLHAHSTLAQLAIRSRDWQQALQHAQQGLQIEPENGACAVLLATAYAWRNEPGDLQAAINHLHSFVGRYSGNVKAEAYLRDLQQRQQWDGHGQFPAFEDDQQAVSVGTSATETDPAWNTFAESVNVWVAESLAGDTPSYQTNGVRVLPLPQAMRQAVRQNEWDVGVLERYDPAVRKEFPLETHLWRYLQTLQSDTYSESDRAHARQALRAWIETETRSPSSDNPSWMPYLKQHWEGLEMPTDTSLADGKEWLKDLLDRYQPLPAPLFA